MQFLHEGYLVTSIKTNHGKAFELEVRIPANQVSDRDLYTVQLSEDVIDLENSGRQIVPDGVAGHGDCNLTFRSSNGFERIGTFTIRVVRDPHLGGVPTWSDPLTIEVVEAPAVVATPAVEVVPAVVATPTVEVVPAAVETRIAEATPTIVDTEVNNEPLNVVATPAVVTVATPTAPETPPALVPTPRALPARAEATPPAEPQTAPAKKNYDGWIIFLATLTFIILLLSVGTPIYFLVRDTDPALNVLKSLNTDGAVEDVAVADAGVQNVPAVTPPAPPAPAPAIQPVAPPPAPSPPPPAPSPSPQPGTSGGGMTIY